MSCKQAVQANIDISFSPYTFAIAMHYTISSCILAVLQTRFPVGQVLLPRFSLKHGMYWYSAP
ncbi:MAG: hypothetical protein QM768_20710 [Agriterribacter sp.]